MLGITHPKGIVNKLAKVITIEKLRAISQTGSVVDNCLIAIATYDKPRQKIIGQMQYIFKEPKPGSVITIIPIKPIDTASHLQNPTFSLKKKIEKMVVNIGAAKEILTTVANGKFLKAINIAIKAIKPNKHLKKCKPALFV